MNRFEVGSLNPGEYPIDDFIKWLNTCKKMGATHIEHDTVLRGDPHPYYFYRAYKVYTPAELRAAKIQTLEAELKILKDQQYET